MIRLDALDSRAASTNNLFGSGVSLEIYLTQTLLSARSLPTQFFTLSNLRVLTLRGNNFETLPAAIGLLSGLK